MSAKKDKIQLEIETRKGKTDAFEISIEFFLVKEKVRKITCKKFCFSKTDTGKSKKNKAFAMKTINKKPIKETAIKKMFLEGKNKFKAKLKGIVRIEKKINSIKIAGIITKNLFKASLNPLIKEIFFLAIKSLTKTEYIALINESKINTKSEKTKIMDDWINNEKALTILSSLERENNSRDWTINGAVKSIKTPYKAAIKNFGKKSFGIFTRVLKASIKTIKNFDINSPTAKENLIQI